MEMKAANALILKNIIELTRSSEDKFKQGDFKGAIEDKICLLYTSPSPRDDR